MSQGAGTLLPVKNRAAIDHAPPSDACWLLGPARALSRNICTRGVPRKQKRITVVLCWFCFGSSSPSAKRFFVLYTHGHRNKSPTPFHPTLRRGIAKQDRMECCECTTHLQTVPVLGQTRGGRLEGELHPGDHPNLFAKHEYGRIVNNQRLEASPRLAPLSQPSPRCPSNGRRR